jgi:hypothetical protein
MHRIVTQHSTEDDLTLYYYGEGRQRADIERHLESCAGCAAAYAEIAGTLAMMAAPEVPERGDQYGREVWQRIRHTLPERESSAWAALASVFRPERLAFAAAAATLVLGAFVAGGVWTRQRADAPATSAPQSAGTSAGTTGGSTAASGDSRQRILLTSVADHLDRSERVLTDIMNAPRGDISAEQRWADDLLDASRLYRQDASDAGEQSVAVVLDDLERSLLEIVNSPSTISAVDLEQIRRRIDAASLLFKVRVMSHEIRQREQAPTTLPRTSTRTTT